MEQQKPSDRRIYARFEILDYAMVIDDGEGNSIRSVVVDVSLGGCQVRSKTQFESEKKYTLTIGRGNMAPVSIKAIARYSKLLDDCDLWASGFEFDSESAAARMAWAEYVHEVFKEQGEMLLG